MHVHGKPPRTTDSKRREVCLETKGSGVAMREAKGNIASPVVRDYLEVCTLVYYLVRPKYKFPDRYLKIETSE